MRIGLVVNSQAGDAAAHDELARTIRRHGHEVVALAEFAEGPEALNLDGVDAIAAAGGDGTIRAVASHAITCDVPLAILPMGTANNIAASLGIPPDLDDAVAGWASARPRAIDVGVATGPWGERWFVESVGGGLVTNGIVLMNRLPPIALAREQQLARAVAMHADALDLADVVPWRLTIDGQEVSGEFLLVELLNIPAIGPNLMMSADASPWDGQLTVVAAGAEHRAALADYLRGRVEAMPELPTWHGTQVRLEAGDRLHVDDEVLEGPETAAIQVRIEPAAARVLVANGGPHLRDR